MLRFIVACHLSIFFLGVIATLITIFAQPWYISFLITILMVNIVFSGCPLTLIENYLRKQQGLPEIDNFLKHYLLR